METTRDLTDLVNELETLNDHMDRALAAGDQRRHADLLDQADAIHDEITALVDPDLAAALSAASGR